MPSTEKKQKSDLISVVDEFLDKKQDKFTGQVEFLSIIDYVDRFKLLPGGLFPVQKFILKLYYGIPLDKINKSIKVSNRLNTKILYEFTEVEYLKYLYSQGRCNIKEQDNIIRHELVLVLGRRSGKSTMSAIIASYEMYKLLRRGNPQSYYGIPDGSEIRILCIANDKEQASIVYGEMTGYVDRVDYFKSALVNSTQTFMKFQTDQDKKHKIKPSITATFKSCIAKGLRGRGIMCYILDELAFFIDTGKSGGKQIYRAINPSIAQFSPKDPKDKHIPLGRSDGRAIAISSPDARDGFFYELYQMSLSGGNESSNMLMIQAPTWEVNPTLDKSYYITELAKDSRAFMTEHGAEFSDRVRGWIEDQNDLLECITPELRPIQRGNHRELFWAGVDFGMVRDGTAISLVHFNNGKIELAYHEVWYAGKDWHKMNPHLVNPISEYANGLSDLKRLDLSEIAEWFNLLSRRFYIDKGVFDQWAGPIFEQELHKRNLKQFEMRNFSTMDSSHAFHSMKMCMYSRQLSLYDYPISNEFNSDSNTLKHSPLISEMLELQSSSGGKNVTVVEAPKVAGKHDDMSDSLVRAVLLATEYMKIHPDVLDSSTVSIAQQDRGPRVSYSYQRFRAMQQKMHGGLRNPRMPINPGKR